MEKLTAMEMLWYQFLMTGRDKSEEKRGIRLQDLEQLLERPLGRSSTMELSLPAVANVHFLSTKVSLTTAEKITPARQNLWSLK